MFEKARRKRALVGRLQAAERSVLNRGVPTAMPPAEILHLAAAFIRFGGMARGAAVIELEIERRSAADPTFAEGIEAAMSTGRREDMEVLADPRISSAFVRLGV